MQIEKPAVVFSEQGWKQFLNFMSELVGNKDEADALVNEYFRRQSEAAAQDGSDSRQLKINTIDKIADLLEYELAIRSKMTNSDILTLLEVYGYDYNLRTVTSLMNSVMKRKPTIKRVGRGVYQHEGEVVADE